MLYRGEILRKKKTQILNSKENIYKQFIYIPISKKAITMKKRF